MSNEPLSTYRPAYVAGLERRVEEITERNKLFADLLSEAYVFLDGADPNAPVLDKIREHAYTIAAARERVERLPDE